MDLISAQYGPWEVECLPADGARLHALRFAGRDLLTGPPERFQPPEQDFGEYETRPVYGYDDCFPSVDPSDLPGHPGIRIRDHGELCWLPLVGHARRPSAHLHDSHDRRTDGAVHTHR